MKGLDLCRALEPRINSDKSRINSSSTIPSLSRRTHSLHCLPAIKTLHLGTIAAHTSISMTSTQHTPMSLSLASPSIQSECPPPPIHSEPCLVSKLNRQPIPHFALRKFIRLALIHMDLKGPLPVTTPEGYIHWMRFWVVAFFRKTGDTFSAFQAFK